MGDVFNFYFTSASDIYQCYLTISFTISYATYLTKLGGQYYQCEAVCMQSGIYDNSYLYRNFFRAPLVPPSANFAVMAATGGALSPIEGSKRVRSLARLPEA